MAGRRPAGIRSGDLNEELGLLLLKAFALVAPVPRPEDVGVDAVATLHRRDPGNLLVAEDSFYVQLKSASVRAIDLAEHEVRWVEGLRLPYFIASVEKERARVELFSTHALTRVLIQGEFKSIRLSLDSDADDAGVERCCWLGPPVLAWTTGVFGDEGFPEHARAVVQPHVRAEQFNITLRPIRSCDTVVWKTGAAPRCGAAHMAFGGDRPAADLATSLMAMSHPLRSAVLHCIDLGDDEAVKAFRAVAEIMRRHGVDPDPHNIFHALPTAIHLSRRLRDQEG